MKKKILYSLFSIVLLAITWLLFGIYWGWIDDIYLANALNGTFFHQPAKSLFISYYVFLSNGLVFLNQLLPKTNWYGIFNLIVLFLIVALFIALTYKLLKRAEQGKFFNILFIFFLFMVALAELIYMQTFTTNSLLLFGLSSLYFLNDPKFRRTALFIILIIAMLIRSDVVFFVFPILFIFILLESKQKVKLVLLFSILTIALPLVFTITNISSNDVKEWKKYSTTIVNVLDGSNSNSFEKMAKIDKARTLALFTWFQGDIDNLLNQEYVEKLDIHPPFSIVSLKKAGVKFQIEYEKSCCKYNQDYTPSRNWINKGIFISFVLIVLSIYFVAIERDKKRKLIMALYPLSFLGAILFAIIFFKMEYRIFYPTAFLYIIALLLSNQQKIKNYLIYALLLLLLIVFPIRIKEYYSTSRDLKAEVNQKELFRAELNSKFSDKLIFFDFLTSGLYSPTFFNYKPFNEGHNTLLLYGEVNSNFIESHKKYLSEICGSDELVPFFECLYQKRDDVIFAFTNHRVEMYEMYFNDVHGKTLKFKKLEQKSNKLNTIHYSYSHNKLFMDYYVFDDSFHEAKCN
jgi:hypothetical protein